MDNEIRIRAARAEDQHRLNAGEVGKDDVVAIADRRVIHGGDER